MVIPPEVSLVDVLHRRLAAVTAEITAAAERVGRDPRAVRLVAVTKMHPAPVLQAALAAGMREIGENYLQEAIEKFTALGWPPTTGGPAPATRHLIGHLQSNKARQAVEWFDVIQTVDSESLAVRIDRIAGELGRRVPVLLQVNTSDEVTKSGFSLPAIEGVFSRLANLAHIQVTGLMTIGRFEPDPTAARSEFRLLRALRDRLATHENPLPDLSMGMSHDFPIAVEEGATIVRVGSRIFGPRQ